MGYLIIFATLYGSIVGNSIAAKLEASHRESSHEMPRVSLSSSSITVQKDIQPDIGHFPWEPKRKETGAKLMNAIHRFRAEICYRMKKESGFDFGTYDKCEEFMRRACIPGHDELMDGDSKERPSGEGYCREFFPEAEKKARKEVEEEEKKEDAEEHETEHEKEAEKETAAAKEPKAEPAESSSGKEIESAPGAPAPASSADTSAPPGIGGAPSPAQAQSPAGASGNKAAAAVKKFTPGISKGKPERELEDGESWYYKKNGKHPDRLHMSEARKLPTQGYWGKLVAHDDMETATSDWQREHDPKDREQTMEEICREYPSSRWCEKHKRFFAKSSAHSNGASVIMVLVLVMAVGSSRTS